MTVVKELIRSELDGTLSFGDYTLDTKTKKDGFEFQGDIYKVKTFKEITLELEPDTDYIVYMNDMNVGDMKTNLSAKLSVSAELGKESVEIKVVRK